jgi:anti-sigma factor RsiW
VQHAVEAYSDGELDASQQSYIEQHLEGCLACREVYDKLQRLQAGIRAQAPYFRAPESLGVRIVSSVYRSESGGVRVWKWMAIAASVALVLSLGAQVFLRKATPTANELLARDLFAGHARSMLGGHLVDVVSSDQHTVKPWFNNKLDFSPDVKDLSSAGYPLFGGRLDYLERRPVAALVFRRAKHVINLFILPSSQSRPEAISENGYHVVSWTRDGMTYCAVSDVNLDDLKVFAQLYGK